MVKVSILKNIPNEHPALYCGNHTPVGRKYGESRDEYCKRIDSLLLEKNEEVRTFMNDLYLKAKDSEVVICTPSNEDSDHLNHIADLINRKLRHPNYKGLYFTGSYATFCLLYDKDSNIIDAPPIAKWTIGKKCDMVVAWYQGKGFTVKKL